MVSHRRPWWRGRVCPQLPPPAHTWAQDHSLCPVHSLPLTLGQAHVGQEQARWLAATCSPPLPAAPVLGHIGTAAERGRAPVKSGRGRTPSPANTKSDQLRSRQASGQSTAGVCKQRATRGSGTAMFPHNSRRGRPLQGVCQSSDSLCHRVS